MGNEEALTVAGMASVDEEAVADREAGSPGRWGRVPRRCISRETSLESYVLPVVDCRSWGSVSADILVDLNLP